MQIKNIDQWKRIESPKINPYVCSQLILIDVPTDWREGSSTNGTGTTRQESHSPHTPLKKETKLLHITCIGTLFSYVTLKRKIALKQGCKTW
jgi:hypothetical protein